VIVFSNPHNEASTTCLSRWVGLSISEVCMTNALTCVVLTDLVLASVE
jgi:hypothetical protein